MRNRILFIGLLLVMVGLSSFAIYRLFFSSRELSRTSSSSVPTKSSKDVEVAEKSAEQEGAHSIWADPRLRGLSGAGSTADSAEAKEIESNLKDLVALYDRGEDKQFLARLDDLIANNPNAKEYVALKGDYYFNEGQWPEAESAVRTLITKDPENMFARTTLAEILAAQGKIDEAFQTQKEVIAKDPGNFEALNGILAVTEMQGKPEIGEEIIRNNAVANPQNARAAASYIDLLRMDGKNDEANRWTEQALKNNPNDPELLQRQAVSLIQQGKAKEAVAAATQAVNLSNTPEGKIIALNVKHQAAYSERDVRTMEEAVKEIESIDPNHQSLAHLKETNELLKK